MGSSWVLAIFSNSLAVVCVKQVWSTVVTPLISTRLACIKHDISSADKCNPRDSIRFLKTQVRSTSATCSPQHGAWFDIADCGTIRVWHFCSVAGPNCKCAILGRRCLPRANAMLKLKIVCCLQLVYGTTLDLLLTLRSCSLRGT